MTSTLRTTAAVAVLALGGCSQSPDDARKELTAIGVGFTPVRFVEAVHDGDERAVRLFLAAGMDPDVDARDFRAGGAGDPLRAAARRGRAAIARILLDAGAAVDAPPPTALVEAAGNGHADLVALLLGAGADPDAHDARRLLGGPSPALALAAEDGHLEILAMLLDAGADPDAGEVPSLVRAAERGHAAIVRALLAAGADPNASKRNTSVGIDDLRRGSRAPERRITALQAAAAEGHEEIVGLLSRAGAT